jgi:hypothetical protein
MKTMTIRDVPEDLHAALKERARRNRRSLNQQVITELGGTDFPGPVDDRDRKRRRAEEVIAMVESMRSRMKRFMTADEIDAAKKEGRR